MQKGIITLISLAIALLLGPVVTLAQDPTPTPTPVPSIVNPLAQIPWIELVIGALLGAVITAFLGIPQRLVKLLFEARDQRVTLLQDQIEFLKTKLAENERLSKLKDDVLAAEKLRLQQELEEARKQAGLPAAPLLREPIALLPEDRETLQKILRRLERIETIAVATDSKALRPTAEEYLSVGDARYFSGQYLEAIESYDQAIKLKPDDPDAFYSRGNTYYRLGQYERAIQDFDQAIKLKPAFPEAFNNRGLTYRHLGQYERAIQDYDKAIKLKPDDHEVLTNRGVAYRHLGQYQRAIQDFDQAIKLKPAFPDAFNNRGLAYRHLGQYERAIQDYDQAIKLGPRSPARFFNRCMAYILLGEHDRALQDFNHALSLKPEPPVEFYNRACFYSLTNDHDQALLWLRKAITLDPSNRVSAKTDLDFDNIRPHPGFKELIGE